MAEPLTVLLGAGASVALGVPGTAALTRTVLQRMRDTERDWQALLPRPISGDTRSDRLIQQLKQGYGASFNFEHVLHALEAVAGLARTWRPSTVPAYRIVEGLLCSGPAGHVVECFADYFTIMGTRAVYEALFESIQTASEAAVNHTDWARWVQFAQDLATGFDVLFSTTNYDHVIEKALSFSPRDEGFHGPSSAGVWRFDARKRDSVRLIHLHGNIRYGHRNPPDEGQVFGEHDHEELFWFENPEQARASWFGRSTARGGGGQELHRGALITGLYKPEKLTIEPYRAYADILYSRLVSCPRLLVIGYGFGDPHLNYVLQRMTRWHGSNRRIAYVGWHKDWPLQPKEIPDHARTLASWAGESGPMSDCMTAPNPYIPARPNDACFRAWFGGFGDVLAHHVHDLKSFLAS